MWRRLILLGTWACCCAASPGYVTGRQETVPPPPSSAEIAFNRDIRPLLSDNCFFCHGPDRNHREADLRLDTAAGLVGTADQPGVVVPGQPDASELFRRITAADESMRMPPPDSGKALTAEEIGLIRRWIEGGGRFEGHWAFEPLKPLAAVAGQSAAQAAATIDALVAQERARHGLAAAAPADRLTLVRRLYLDLLGLPPTTEEVEAFLADSSPAAYEHLLDRLLASPHFGERLAIWWLDLVRYADTVGYHGDQPMSVAPFRQYVIESFNANKPFDQFTLEQLAGDLLPGATPEQKIASGYNRLGMMSAEGGVQDKEYLAKYIAERVRNASGTWLGVTLGCAECHDHKFDPFTTRDFYRFEAFFADIKERGLYSGANDSGNWGPFVQVPTAEQAAEVKRLEQAIAETRAVLQVDTPELNLEQQAWENGSHAQRVIWGFRPLPDAVTLVIFIPPEQRSPQQLTFLNQYFRRYTPRLGPAWKRLATLEVELRTVQQQIPTTLVTEAVQPRMVRVLKRGNWMDESGEIVTAGFPEALGGEPASSGQLTRLDLAKWIVAPENPLTARVLANRLWKLYFGAGLSRKLDDVGAQGDWPSHPELLDFLANDLRENGWDLKRTIRAIVLSATYRQVSTADASLRELDPYNRWLARQGRFRLDAELVRDNALAISGLLVSSVGGKSVFPYQPPGYWAYLNFPTREWQNGNGDELYRRGLYTHWQRQYLHPSLLAFDAPSREECTADRPRSNTPLQALVLLNDPSYVEAARGLAEILIRQAGPEPAARIDLAFRRALARPAQPAEIEVLRELYEHHRQEFANDPAAAAEVLKVGAKPAANDLPSEELAAWTSVARVILNLHETVTRY